MVEAAEVSLRLCLPAWCCCWLAHLVAACVCVCSIDDGGGGGGEFPLLSPCLQNAECVRVCVCTWKHILLLNLIRDNIVVFSRCTAFRHQTALPVVVVAVVTSVSASCMRQCVCVCWRTLSSLKLLPAQSDAYVLLWAAFVGRVLRKTLKVAAAALVLPFPSYGHLCSRAYSEGTIRCWNAAPSTESWQQQQQQQHEVFEYLLCSFLRFSTLVRMILIYVPIIRCFKSTAV